jgi:hypothetical protein
VVREDDHPVAPALKPYSRIDDEAFGAPNAQVWVKEDDCPFPIQRPSV